MTRCRIEPFGRLPDGRPASLAILSLPSGLRVAITDIGASLVRIETPDRHGQYADVLLGCDHAAAHWEQTCYLGAIVGRSAGRIREATAQLDGRTLRLTRNHGAHHLHGGAIGLSRRLWRIEGAAHDPAVTLSTTSDDGDEGYPGKLDVSLTYRLIEPGSLEIVIAATATQATLFNPTSHGYFNLNGHNAGSIADHELCIAAHRITPLDADLLPVGTVAPVTGTPFDFTRPKPIGPNALPSGGYDQTFVLDRRGAEAPAAVLYAPRTGRSLSVRTDRPCLHLYTGGFLDVPSGKGGARYSPGAGLCLETQGFPDSLNHTGFPDEMIRAGQVFTTTTILDFGAKERA